MHRVLQFSIAYLRPAPAREFEFRAEHKPPLILIADGWQKDLGPPYELGAGAVIWDPLTARLEYFSMRIDDDLLDRWSSKGTKAMLINQAELIPALVARFTWKDLFRRRTMIHFVDNDGVRDAFIRGNSSSSDSGVMLGLLTLIDVQLKRDVWIERVPSPSNIADGPSRFDH